MNLVTCCENCSSLVFLDILCWSAVVLHVALLVSVAWCLRCCVVMLQYLVEVVTKQQSQQMSAHDSGHCPHYTLHCPSVFDVCWRRWLRKKHSFNLIHLCSEWLTTAVSVLQLLSLFMISIFMSATRPSFVTQWLCQSCCSVLFSSLTTSWKLLIFSNSNWVVNSSM